MSYYFHDDIMHGFQRNPSFLSLNFRISGKYIDEARKELERNPNTTDGDLTILNSIIQNERMPNAFIVNLMAAILFGGVEQVRQQF